MNNEYLPKTLQEAILYFADEQKCHEFLANIRWPNGPICPHCGSQRVSFLERQRRFQCSTRHPKRQFSVKVGTIFEDSPLPLSKWLPAMWLIGNAKNGISSYEIARDLNVTQKTAWFMLHRIRLAMGVDNDKFSGTVEADETFIGGRSVNMHKSKRDKVIRGRGGVGKVAVMGLLERHGNDASRVQTKILADTSRQTIPPAVRQSVEAGSNLITDAHGCFGGGYSGAHAGDTPEEAALFALREKGRYIATNPLGGEMYLPTEVKAALELAKV